MGQYTRADVKLILAGLATGKPAHYRPCSDAEFQARYDPQGYQADRALALLTEIKEILERLSPREKPQQRQNPPLAYSRSQPLAGPTET